MTLAITELTVQSPAGQPVTLFSGGWPFCEVCTMMAIRFGQFLIAFMFIARRRFLDLELLPLRFSLKAQRSKIPGDARICDGFGSERLHRISLNGDH
jgi:hypothetical protein